ncbi:MAG: alpha-galactosidase [Anaerolineae bacterium]
MSKGLVTAIKAKGLPVGSLLREGPGFRFGRLQSALEPTQQGDSHWIYVDDQKLTVEATLRWDKETAIISHTLRNTSDTISLPLDTIEPLRLEFDHLPDAWRHIYANGGTTENYYPPLAYRTHEITHLASQSWPHRALTLESHPLGRSSNQHLPLLISLASTDPDSEGLFCGMEWSGAWYLRVGGTEDGGSVLEAGIKVKGLRLEPGEALRMPDVHLGFFRGGAAAGTNALRRYLYEAVCPTYQGKPTLPRVSYDHWFGIANALNHQKMCEEADRAAALGVETFVVDAAWFPGDFPYGVGNWEAIDTNKFPEGLGPLADYVRSLGMDFGLWFEPERGVEDTMWVRDHPDWFLKIPVAQFDTQKKAMYHLNLARQDVQDHVIQVVGGWIEALDVRWSRWDYNIDPLPYWDAVDPTGKIQFAYMEGLYRVLDTLMKDHPNWMVEGCASGGRRVDLGTMRRAHTYWFSDQTVSPLLCRYMQARANRFLPGHLCNSSVAVGFSQGDAGFDDASVLSRMLGKLAFDGDVASWSSELTDRMAVWVEEFKATRHLMVQNFFQLLPIPSTAEDWDALEFANYGGDEAALFVYAGSKDARRAIALQGLSAQATYQVRRSCDGSCAVRVSGAELIEDGLVVGLEAGEAGLWRIVAD